MKEWIVLQGWPLYLMLGMTGLGLLGSILSRIFYGRLAREAQLCGTSDYPMLHYIRQKYSSYYGYASGQCGGTCKKISCIT